MCHDVRGLTFSELSLNIYFSSCGKTVSCRAHIFYTYLQANISHSCNFLPQYSSSLILWLFLYFVMLCWSFDLEWFVWCHLQVKTSWILTATVCTSILKDIHSLRPRPLIHAISDVIQAAKTIFTFPFLIFHFHPLACARFTKEY